MKSDKNDLLLGEALRALDFYRKLILDVLEEVVPDPKTWNYIRNRLFFALGDRGLAGRLSEILAKGRSHE